MADKFGYGTLEDGVVWIVIASSEREPGIYTVEPVAYPTRDQALESAAWFNEQADDEAFYFEVEGFNLKPMEGGDTE